MIRNLLYWLIFPVVIALPSLCSAQSYKEFKQQVHELAAYHSGIQAHSPFADDGAWSDTIEMYNDLLSNGLTGLLSNRNIVKFGLDTLFSEIGDLYKKSDDGKFYVFNWYANNGGSWHIYYEILFAILPNGNTYVSGPIETVGTYAIHSFSTSAGDVYLALASGITCNSCIAEKADAYILSDTALLPAKGFFDGEASGWLVDARRGNVEEFGYEPSTQLFSVSYLTDDLNAGASEQDWVKPVKYAFKFNGEFLEYIKEYKK